MAKAGDKSSTSDQIGTEKFKPKTRSTDDPQVKRAQQQAVRNAVEKFKAGHRAPRSISLWEKTERRKKTKWRVRLDRERKQRKRLFETWRQAASCRSPEVVGCHIQGAGGYKKCH